MQKFYQIISIIFMPLLMPTYGMFLLFETESFTYLPLFFKSVTVGGTFLITAVFPLIPILIMKKKGIVSDLFISNKEERVMPYLFTFLAYIIWAFFLWRLLEMPVYVSALAIGGAVSVFFSVLINIKWKISAHMVGIGGLTGGIFGICYHLGMNPVLFLILIIFLSILVGLARVELKAHTPLQVLIGFTLGILSVFLGVFFLS